MSGGREGRVGFLSLESPGPRSSCRMTDKPQYKTRLDPNDVGLPVRPFLYTLDQIATLLSITTEVVKAQHLYYEGRDAGKRPRDKMLARNLAPDGETPDWRVMERELVRWLKYKGFHVYERGWGVL